MKKATKSAAVEEAVTEAVAEAVADKFDDVRIAVGKVDALASAAEELFDNTTWGDALDRQRGERIAHLIGATREAAEAAVSAVDELEIAAMSPAINGEGWA